MDLILGILTGNLIGVLPFVVLLLLCVGGYLITKRGGPAVFDSPWFWAFAFSAVGLLGVWAISGKYDDRQKRLEARYEARERIAEQRLSAVHTQTGADQANMDAKRNYGDDAAAALHVGYSPERRVPLRYLATGLLIVSVTSGLMLWRNQRVAARQHN
jgi:hypothetical protein